MRTFKTPALSRHTSSFGNKTSEDHRTMLSLNAQRADVIVLGSGVQLLMLKAGKEQIDVAARRDVLTTRKRIQDDEFTPLSLKKNGREATFAGARFAQLSFKGTGREAERTEDGFDQLGLNETDRKVKKTEDGFDQLGLDKTDRKVKKTEDEFAPLGSNETDRKVKKTEDLKKTDREAKKTEDEFAPLGLKETDREFKRTGDGFERTRDDFTSPLKMQKEPSLRKTESFQRNEDDSGFPFKQKNVDRELSFRKTRVESCKQNENDVDRESSVTFRGAEDEAAVPLKQRRSNGKLTREESQGYSKPKKQNAEKLLWRLGIKQRDGSVMGQNVTLRNATRGMASVLRSGMLTKGSTWRIWIPAEVSGDKTNSVSVLDVQVLRIQKKPHFAKQVIAGLCGAFWAAIRSWFMSKLNLTNKSHRYALSDAPLCINDAGLKISRVHIRFFVDTVDMGQVAFDVAQDSPSGRWFLEACRNGFFLNRIVVGNETNGLLCSLPRMNDVSMARKPGKVIKTSVVSVCKEDDDEEEEDQDIQSEIPGLPHTSELVVHPDDGKINLFVHPRFATFSIARGNKAALPNQLSIFVGTLFSGEDTIHALQNCEDGGMFDSCSIETVE